MYLTNVFFVYMMVFEIKKKCMDIALILPYFEVILSDISTSTQPDLMVIKTISILLLRIVQSEQSVHFR